MPCATAYILSPSLSCCLEKLWTERTSLNAITVTLTLRPQETHYKQHEQLVARLWMQLEEE